LKQPAGVEVVLRLAQRAEVLFEGFRPGVAERLGVGPEACLARNPALVYGRRTGWGQDGPLAPAAGHDMAHIGMARALQRVGPPARGGEEGGGGGGGGGWWGRGGRGGGGRGARRPGGGRGVDAAIVDGTALLTAMFHGLRGGGGWSDVREANLLDGGPPFYR